MARKKDKMSGGLAAPPLSAGTSPAANAAGHKTTGTPPAEPPKNDPRPPAPAEPPSGRPDPDQIPPAVADEMSRGLRSIYDTPGQEQRDMTKLDQARGSLAKKILIGSVIFFAFLAAVSWAGFFFFSPSDEKFSGEGVEVAIDGPAQLKSGDLVTYQVTYRNNENVPLGTASLQLRLPKELAILSLDPAPIEDIQNSWKIGSIAPGNGGTLTLRGVVLAPIGKQLDLQAILTYRPADFNSEFQKVSTRTVGVSDSVLDLTVSGPAKAMPGDKIELDLSYINTSDNEFQKVRLKAAFPANFIPESSDPAPSPNDNSEWLIDAVAPNTQGHVKVVGSFASDAKGRIETKAEIGFVDANDDFQLQKEAVFATDVVEGQLVVALILNGKSGDQPVSFGDTLHYAVTYRNTGTVILEDVALSVALEAQPDASQFVQWNNLRDKQEGLRDMNKITWTKKQVTALGRVGPEEEGTINFDLPALAAPLLDPNVQDYRLSSWVEAVIGKIDGEPVNRKTQTPPFAAVFLSDAKLAAEAHYFNTDGIPVGSGPLPPVVGQATTYRVSWQLTNALHDLSDLKLSARLPENVVWNGRSNVDAGDLKFDAAHEKIIWTLNWLPTSIKDLRIDFDVAITPTGDQAGKVPTLIDASILEAMDKVTGAPLILSKPPLTPEPENDSLAGGKGRVLGQ